MKYDLCFDNNCLDLPSLTEIKGYSHIHGYMGYVILESMIWFDLIWFDLIWFDLIWFDLIWFDLNRYSKSHWKQHSLWKKCIFLDCRFTSNKYFSFHFHFHILDADGLRYFSILHSQINLVQEGIQSKERYFILPNQTINDIPTDIQHLYLCGFKDYEYNNLIFSNNTFHQLKSITIGNECFKNVREFVLDGLESLESVKIGEECFRIGEEERDDGICRITNCPNLTQLEMSYESFADFKSFELSNLNSIQSIKFGDFCFEYADFSLKGEWKEKKEMWFEWKWKCKWCFRSSIIRNRYFWRSFIYVLSSCCIWKYVMIVYFHFISHSRSSYITYHFIQ